MPTKQWYLDNHDSAASMLAHAVANHSCANIMPYIKIKSDGQYEIKVEEDGNPSNNAIGVGPDKQDAMAEALGIFTTA